MRDTREPRLNEVPHGGTLNIVDRVGLRNSVRKADFNLLVLQSSMGIRWTQQLPIKQQNGKAEVAKFIPERDIP